MQADHCHDRGCVPVEDSQLLYVGPVVGEHGGAGEEEGKETELQVPDHHRGLVTLLDKPLVEDAGKSGGAAGDKHGDEAGERVLLLGSKIVGNLVGALDKDDPGHENQQGDPLSWSESST